MRNESPDIRKLLAQANLIIDLTRPALTCQDALAVSGMQVTSHLQAKHQMPLHLYDQASRIKPRFEKSWRGDDNRSVVKLVSGG